MRVFGIRNYTFWAFYTLVIIPWVSWAFGPHYDYYHGGIKTPSQRRLGHGPVVLSSHHPEANSHESSSSSHPMSKTSFLSHVMLKVPSVDRTVEYWTRKGAKIRMSRPKNPEATNGDVELLSAFVELGCSSSGKSGSSKSPSDDTAPSPICFALELVSTSKSSSSDSSKQSYSIGNAISYIGVSMLMQFQNNLLGAITGQETPATQGDEPNGIRVQSVASAPGDFLARLALQSTNLTTTQQFYTTILGMETKAQDETMLCLRYDNAGFSTGGVPTTLVFDKVQDGTTIQVGDCFDHLVIATQTSIEELYARFSNSAATADDIEECRIFMKPTDMFGKKVMGLLDPNGYKVILASAS